MKRTRHNEALALLQQGEQAQPVLITEAHLLGLPEVVQRYLRYTQIVGKETIRTVRLKQQGLFRTKPDQKWMPLVAEEYYTTQPPAFMWYGTMRPFPLLAMSVKEMFSGGHGSRLVKVLSFITLADIHGPQVDQSALVRYLAEMALFPTAWLSDYIQWQAIDATSAKATICHQGLMAWVILHVNEKGQVTHLTAEAFWTERRQYVLKPWSAQVKDYQNVDGIWMPVKFDLAWNLESADFSYFRGQITEIEYNQSGKATRF